MFLAGFPSANAEPRTLVVPDNYPTIKAALENAVDGDTVLVKKGVYHENLKVNASISLVGEDRDTTIIDGNPPRRLPYPHRHKTRRRNHSKPHFMRWILGRADGQRQKLHGRR